MFKLGAFLALTLIGGLFLNAAVIPTAHAATNAITQLVPFQGRLHNSEGNVVADGVYDLAFYIYETATGGEFVWSESHTQVSVIHGYVNVLLGGTESGKFADKNVDFSTQKYLSISIDAGQEMFPRHQLVPTFHAYDASKLGGIDAVDYATDSEVTSIIQRVDGDINTTNTNITNILGERFVDAGNTAKKAVVADSATSSVNADKLDGQHGSFYQNASNLNEGTISTSRLPSATTTMRGATKKNQMGNATNGYFWDKETGFIMQWGFGSTTNDGAHRINFPISMTTAHNVNITMKNTEGWSNFGGLWVHSFDANGFYANRNDALDSYTAQFYWQAIGYKAP
jgi:hypothetical protein